MITIDKTRGEYFGGANRKFRMPIGQGQEDEVSFEKRLVFDFISFQHGMPFMLTITSLLTYVKHTKILSEMN